MVLSIATTNQGKLADFSAAATATLHGEPLTLEPLPGLKQIPAPAEDELTFAGNARIKALYYSRLAPEATVLADDSGLEVDALDLAPGVRSARYADDLGFVASSDLAADPTSNLSPLDQRNNQCLLHALRSVPLQARTGRYRCVLAAARNGQLLAEGDGTIEGLILLSPRGSSGFGYDPLFYLPTLDRTMAELDAATKLTLSHRGRALRSLLKTL